MMQPDAIMTDRDAIMMLPDAIMTDWDAIMMQPDAIMIDRDAIMMQFNLHSPYKATAFVIRERLYGSFNPELSHAPPAGLLTNNCLEEKLQSLKHTFNSALDPAHILIIQVKNMARACGTLLNFHFYYQRIKIRCYNIHRAYGSSIFF